ncbi:hypothetical protein [Gallaecimonas mangrovi]|uniref:hypothetical protein n=1 Tax=Gallaecimonas mangrovi TaxID=2291597 RepID=UPI0012602C35|nr:hypothetical protein [Gallaecimonas mangrovi]
MQYVRKLIFNPIVARKEKKQLGMAPTHWRNAVTSQQQARQAELAQLTNHGGGMGANEGRLAEYLYDRRMLNRTIEGPELARLRGANETVETTRARLNMGRGNVRTDIFRPGAFHESSRRTEIARDLTDAMVNYETGITKAPMSNSRYGQLSASAAERTRAGNCGEHAHLATHLHAARLGSQEQVHMASSTSVDHAWSELRGPNAHTSDVIMDAWSSGSAILREDASFAHNPAQVQTHYAYNQASGLLAHQDQQQLTQHLATATDARNFVNNRHNQLTASNFHYSNGTYSPTPALSESFTRRANNAHNSLVNQPSSPQQPAGHSFHLAGIVATGVARSLGDNVSQATRRANTVVARGINSHWE